MLQLYFWPMACSLASRIALMEAGIEARYRLVDIFNKEILENYGDFYRVSVKGAVPVLVLDDGETLTENAAVLQYIADLRPDRQLAPPAGHRDRYRLQEWISFVGTEIHKAFLFPTFWYANDAAKDVARERIGRNVGIVATHLETRQNLVGGSFTVADAYLVWALLLLKRGGVDPAEWPSLRDYLARMLERGQVKAAVEYEQQLRQEFPQQMRQRTPEPA